MQSYFKSTQSISSEGKPQNQKNIGREESKNCNGKRRPNCLQIHIHWQHSFIEGLLLEWFGEYTQRRTGFSAGCSPWGFRGLLWKFYPVLSKRHWQCAKHWWQQLGQSTFLNDFQRIGMHRLWRKSVL